MNTHDGPQSPLFTALPLKGNATLKELAKREVSKTLSEGSVHAPRGSGTGWGIPFDVRRIVLAGKKPVTAPLGALKTRWLVFMHTADVEPQQPDKDGLVRAYRGEGHLGKPVADYVFCYADGSEERVAVRRRRQIGAVARPWGENCFEAVPWRKQATLRTLSDQRQFPDIQWGQSQTRVLNLDGGPWTNWLWAWENPHPRKPLAALRVEPAGATVIISAISAGDVSRHPLRWDTRRKAVLKLPRGVTFDPTLDERCQIKDLQLDMGQVISAMPRFVYPKGAWGKTYNNQMPGLAPDEVLVEYAAHPDARFHLPGGKTIPVAEVEKRGGAGPLTPVAPTTQRVRLRVLEKSSGKPVPVKLHVHGDAGEYLAPLDRHRIPNPHWFEDYSCDFVNQRKHWCTYIPGETEINLPRGRVYLEVSKGFEIRPVRKVLTIGKATREIVIDIEKILPWRERGWVTADTHVHFLSPATARLEGAAEGVNVVNLLASQWGELMTNVGDFDGTTTFGSKEAGGDGEWLVRVGTENRQHVLGHISLLGYNGGIIAPMCSGGADESAIGDPVGILLSEWARQCKVQGGLVVLPHFPNPRAEHAATIVQGDIDAIEMTSWGNLYFGINPYSLSDWYRYLNCGYFLPAVGGTDKMSADTAVGTVRTYARIAADREFTYAAWMDAVRAGHTFVTYGPLMDFRVDGKPSGTWIRMGRDGGTVDVTWELASVTVPMSRVDLMVNGEVCESRAVDPWEDAGNWRLTVARSSWIAILVRARYPDKPEMIAAHPSPVMVELAGSPFLAAADALTILDQIEGALAYLDTVGTRAETAAYKRMRMRLTAAHRRLHNQMHEQGFGHAHTTAHDHKEHH
jgi:hypothetical protein